MKRRSGFTLVEMLAAISVGSVLLVLSMGMVHQALRLESESRDQTRLSRSLTRLRQDFRHDVQRATTVELSRETELVLTLSDKSMATYSVLDGHLLQEQELEDGTTKREFYDLPSDSVVSFTEHKSPNRLELSVTHDLQLIGVATRPMLHTVAELGRLLRLTSSQETQP